MWEEVAVEGNKNFRVLATCSAEMDLNGGFGRLKWSLALFVEAKTVVATMTMKGRV